MANRLQYDVAKLLACFNTFIISIFSYSINSARAHFERLAKSFTRNLWTEFLGICILPVKAADKLDTSYDINLQMQ